MSDALATINGQTLKHVRLAVNRQGPWLADVEFVDEPALANNDSCILQIVGSQLRGTCKRTGSYGGSRKATVVAGAGGWSSFPAAKSYHNDAGLKGSEIAADTARAVGETIGTFVPAQSRIGVDYVRRSNVSAAQTIVVCAGAAEWWVDYDGLTNVGRRPAPPDLKGQLTAYDPELNKAELDLDDISTLTVGSIIKDTGVVYSYEITVDSALKAVCWLQPSLAATFTALIQREIQKLLLGKYRYRVISMTADRVNCQIVNPTKDMLPDIATVSMFYGTPAKVTSIRQGSEVLVEFIAGDYTQPVITAFQVDAASEPVARKGDAVKTGPSSPTQTITLAGAGQGAGTYTFTFSESGYLVGEITEGSDKVALP